jgi:hypothetical protein
MTPERREEIILEMVDEFKKSPLSEQFDFKHARKDELIEWHHTLGRTIRGEFGLWEENWEPILVDGVDMSPNHPDAISMSIIEEIWRRVQ